MSGGAKGWIATLLIALLVLAAGCDRGAPDADEAAAIENAEDDPLIGDPDARPPVVEQLPSKVRVEVAGAHQFVWEGEQFVHFTRAGAPGRSVNLLSAGFESPQPLDEDPRQRFRWAFDLREYADAPGTFSLSGVVGGEGSSAFVIIMRVTDGSKPAVHDWDEVELFEQYQRLEEPCSLELGEQHRSGELRCPALAEEGGKTVSLRVTWSAR
jgi:hypothetical protein